LEIQNREKDIGGGGGDINTDLADVPVEHDEGKN